MPFEEAEHAVTELAGTAEHKQGITGEVVTGQGLDVGEELFQSDVTDIGRLGPLRPARGLRGGCKDSVRLRLGVGRLDRFL